MLTAGDVFDDPGPRDACGVFGVWAPGEEVAKLTYFGLYALQHRGQESAGMAVSNGERIMVFKDMGLVSQVFDEPTLSSLIGFMAVGHCRYSTTGASTWENAQPTFRGAHDFGLALAHNGNLTNTDELEAWLGETLEAAEVPRKNRMDSTSDTALVTALLTGHAEHGLTEAALTVLPRLQGAFCLVFADERTLFAARDPQGIHPLVLGRLAGGWVVASETAALDIIGASLIREVEPGELITVDEAGLRSHRFAEARPKGCLFEYVYLARPDTLISGRRVHAVRVEIGRTLAMEAPADADLVIPTPESGTPSAIGYAEASGIPYGLGLVKNSYVGRTFIQPSQTIRQLGIRLKLNPIRDIIEGKRLVVVDDSIVRGNTQRALVKMLREAGALEVHVRISSPPVQWPCFFGIDFATRAELIAPGLTVDEICRSLGADSLGYISLEGLIASTGIPGRKLCRACFDGEYPIPIPADRARQMGLEQKLAVESAYAAAGVDIAAGDRAVELMKAAVAATHRPEVLGGLGGFAGFFDASALAGYRRPVLATSTDGVGTKVAIAQELGVYDTIGWDLVGMLVDDLVVTGAEPLFVTDYIACGKVHPERIAAIVSGIAAACTAAGAALLGGETAEHPGLLEPDEFDVAGATTGVVEYEEILGAARVRPGDVVLALASSGLHSNGFSLVRHVVAKAGWRLEREVPELGTTLGEALLTPTRVYAKDLLAIIRAAEVHAISHITGGGLANNLVRVLPDGIVVDLDRATWAPAPIFGLVQQLGGVSQPDIEATLNMGVGMALLVPEAAVDVARRVAAQAGIESWVAGVARSEDGGPARVNLHGVHH